MNDSKRGKKDKYGRQRYIRPKCLSFDSKNASRPEVPVPVI